MSEKVFWYFSSSFSMFTHPKYEEIRRMHIPRVLKVVSEGLENRLICAKGFYADSQDWLYKWPLLLEQKINGGVFFTLDAQGYVGKGVITEIVGALTKGLSVFLVLHDGRFVQVASLADTEDTYAFVEGPNWNQYRKIHTGECVQCAKLGLLTECGNCEKRVCLPCWNSLKDTEIFPGSHYCSACAEALAPDDDHPF